MSRDVLQIAKERETLYDIVQGFFRRRGYTEVETPILVRSPGMEPNLTPFETMLHASGSMFHGSLITSPEYSMKKLLGLGCEKIFTFAKVFRNGEPFDDTHNPEFTLLEWYQQGADYRACMDETEALVRAVMSAFPPLPKGRLGGVADGSFHRKSVQELFLEHVGLDLAEATSYKLQAACATYNIHTDPTDTESDLFYRLFLSLVEPNLGSDPVFVYDYPKHQAALSALTPDGKFGQRFELYIDGLELCNAFTELVDANEQRTRFLEEAIERRSTGKTVFPIDEELLALLPSVRQPTFGNALGLDRLFMIATGKKNIADVLLFPAKELFRHGIEG